MSRLRSASYSSSGSGYTAESLVLSPKFRANGKLARIRNSRFRSELGVAGKAGLEQPQEIQNGIGGEQTEHTGQHHHALPGLHEVRKDPRDEDEEKRQRDY